MNAATADLVVMVVFGGLLGVIMKLYMSISGMDKDVQATIDRAQRSLKERLGDAFDREKLRAQNEALFRSMPKSGWLALVFIYGLVGMLVAVVHLSPVSMRWWPFLLSLLGAFMLADLVFTRSRAAARKAAAHPADDRNAVQR